MKILIIILVVVIAAGLGAWIILARSNNSTYVAVDSYSPIPVLSSTASPSTSYIAATYSPTPSKVAATPTPRTTPPARTPVFITLDSVGTSSQHGVVAITANAKDQAVVSFNISGVPSGIKEQTAIVGGTCVNLGNVLDWLQPLTNGYSMSILNNNFLEIAQSKTSLSIIVYAEADQPMTPVACGQL